MILYCSALNVVVAIIYQAYAGLDLLRQVEISEHQINQDSHAIKSFLIAHKSCLSSYFCLLDLCL